MDTKLIIIREFAFKNDIIIKFLLLKRKKMSFFLVINAKNVTFVHYNQNKYRYEKILQVNRSHNIGLWFCTDRFCTKGRKGL